ncbi:MAG: lipocalin-like domain-containing protein [Candidatus Acidiferrum sp.]
MKPLLGLTLATVVALSGVSLARSATEKGPSPASDREKFIGAWYLVSLGQPGADGMSNSLAGLKGILLYTRDGHMSVQLMYPPSASSLTNDYVKNGYEASFGSYDVDEARHTVTHHVQGSITEGLVGKALRRVYQFTGDGHLVIKSANRDEHWSVTWEHY